MKKLIDIICLPAVLVIAMGLIAGMGGILSGSHTILQDLKNEAGEQAGLNADQATILQDQDVRNFLSDEAFQSPDWKALTAINGWDVKMTERRERFNHMADNVIFPGFISEARQVAATAINRELPTSDEFPVFESLLEATTSACTVGDKTPAEYIDGQTPGEAASYLHFSPRTPGQQEVALNAYRTAVAAGVKHLCPNK